MATTTNGEALDTSASNGVAESPYIKEITKSIRNINKKLSSTHKTDAVIAENPGVSLDGLLAQRKINADQKASILKKPYLQGQLSILEEQLSLHRKIESESHSTHIKQTDDLRAQHASELARLKEEAGKKGSEDTKAQLKSSLLIFSQFLRAAAAKRSEGNEDTPESKAFEGVLLQVYGGDDASVDAAMKIIEGSEEKAPAIDGTDTTVTFADIKKASVEHSPFQAEEDWVESVNEAAGSDPTLVNAGLTEPQDALTNGPVEPQSQPSDVANAAGNRWDSNPISGGDSALEESYEVIPRPDEEVDVPAGVETDAPTNAGLIDSVVDTAAKPSWDDQVPAYAAPPVKPEGDGFQEVPGRSRGRGRGGAHRGDGERGRGGRGGRGRGGFGGRGRGDGEFRGRGGRGRGRGDGPPPPRS